MQEMLDSTWFSDIFFLSLIQKSARKKLVATSHFVSDGNLFGDALATSGKRKHGQSRISTRPPEFFCTFENMKNLIKTQNFQILFIDFSISM